MDFTVTPFSRPICGQTAGFAEPLPPPWPRFNAASADCEGQNRPGGRDVKNLKTRAAAAATILGLGGLTGVALSSGGQRASSLADKPVVRTKVIHRTVRVTKHVKPKRPVAAGGAGYAGGTAGASRGGSVATGASSTGSGSPSYESSPVTTSTSGTSSPSHSGSGSAPVVTHTSGSSAASGGSESGGTTPVTTGSSTTGGAAGGGGGEVEQEGEGGGDD
jgi:hypothetical protein